MPNVKLRLKTEIIPWHKLDNIDGLSSPILFDEKTPFIEIDEETAIKVLNSVNGHVFEIEDIEENFPISKETLQAQYLEITGVEANKRWTIEKLQVAIDEFIALQSSEVVEETAPQDVVIN